MLFTPAVALLCLVASTTARALPASEAGWEERAAGSCSYWLENIKHQGVVAFSPPSRHYQVFRNVKSYGAVGNGIADDTAAINSAISAGKRTAPSSGLSSTTDAAIVYFPAGTYKVSSPILDYFFTQVIGNAVCPPTIVAASNFSTAGKNQVSVFEGDPSGGYSAVNIFFHQLRNFVFDITNAPANTTAINWPTGQASSLQNIAIKMSQAAGNTQQGVTTGGSGQFMTDVSFVGGNIGLAAGNQQYTFRNLTFSNCKTAISYVPGFDWGQTFKGITIDGSSVGIDMSSGTSAVTVIDSTISNTPIGIRTGNGSPGGNNTAGSVALENVQFNSVSTGAVVGPNNAVILAGGTTLVAGFAYGHQYTGTAGPTTLDGTITPNTRPASLLGTNGYYSQSKPQYQTLPLTSFVSARSSGAKGDGKTDDTKALQNAITSSASAGKVLFVDAGTYKVTSTITIPPGAKIVGEAYPVILSSGPFFAKQAAPKPVVQVGTTNQQGVVQLSDLIVSTAGTGSGTGGQAGAILMEWNLKSPSSAPSGAWDVHTRIGGAIGTNFTSSVCPATPGTPATAANIPKHCLAAYMGMWLTPSSGGVYLENNWIWVADHDIDGAASKSGGGAHITIFSGRGTLVESKGPVWMYGHASEHHQLYQYQFLNAGTIYAGQLQSETAYWQPNPNAMLPFTVNNAIGDPTFPTTSYTAQTPAGADVPNANGWGLRVVNSTDILFYGVGHYSFFNNYSTTCSGSSLKTCQSRITSFEGSTGISVYDLHTVGTQQMITVNGVDTAYWTANNAGFSNEVIVFRTE